MPEPGPEPGLEPAQSWVSVSFPSLSSLAHRKLPEKTQTRQHQGPSLRAWPRRRETQTRRGVGRPGGATARLPNPPVKPGCASFQEEGGEPQERARPKFSGREKTGRLPWPLPPPSVLRLCPAPKASAKLVSLPPTLTSPDICCPTPSFKGLPGKPRSACNGGHCPPLFPTLLLPALS